MKLSTPEYEVGGKYIYINVEWLKSDCRIEVRIASREPHPIRYRDVALEAYDESGEKIPLKGRDSDEIWSGVGINSMSFVTIGTYECTLRASQKPAKFNLSIGGATRTFWLGK